MEFKVIKAGACLKRGDNPLKEIGTVPQAAITEARIIKNQFMPMEYYSFTHK